MAKIVKAHILSEDAGGVDAAGRSTQLPEDTWDYQKTGAKEPPITSTPSASSSRSTPGTTAA